MITKEHYQYIRQHPAFVNLPVELFDKLAVEINIERFQKDKLSFLRGIVVSVSSSCLKVMCGLSSMIRQTHFHSNKLIDIVSLCILYPPLI